MAYQKLETEDKARDAAFNKAMHGTSAASTGGFAAMMGKNSEARKAATDEYFKHWDNKIAKDETASDREARVAEYATLTRHYYNLSTDLYENGWGQSFHMCRFAYGEGFHAAIARHEHYLAYKIGIQKNMTVLDVGCGVGGPARQIAKFTGCKVVGLNNNDYQIERAIRYAEKDGLSNQCSYVKGDFMQMSFPDNSFDAVYAIEATVHAPSLEGIYTEIFRVLKPGGVFGVYEWLMTEKYDPTNVEHRNIRLGIEQGNGISNMEPISVALAAMKAAGFELELHEDMAKRPDAIPWYYPLSGEWKYLSSPWDMFTILRKTRVGRGAVHWFIGALEMIRFAPQGTQKMADKLAYGADNLVEGAKKDLFTPMYLMVGRKPMV